MRSIMCIVVRTSLQYTNTHPAPPLHTCVLNASARRRYRYTETHPDGATVRQVIRAPALTTGIARLSSRPSTSHSSAIADDTPPTTPCEMTDTGSRSPTTTDRYVAVTMNDAVALAVTPISVLPFAKRNDDGVASLTPKKDAHGSPIVTSSVA